PRSTLFPYTTLFRSADLQAQLHQARTPHLVALFDAHEMFAIAVSAMRREVTRECRRRRAGGGIFGDTDTGREHARMKIVAGLGRSEEHTSELQSQSN